MPKINFTIPELSGDRKYFVKLDKLEGLHPFRGPYKWRNQYSETDNSHVLLVRYEQRGIIELMSYPYKKEENDRECLEPDFRKPLTTIFHSLEYLPDEIPGV